MESIAVFDTRTSSRADEKFHCLLEDYGSTALSVILSISISKAVLLDGKRNMYRSIVI